MTIREHRVCVLKWRISGFVLLILLGIFVRQIFAENTYTIETSIQEAFQNNWSIRQKKEKVQESIYDKRKSRSEFFPKLSTTYSYTRVGDVETAAIPSFDGSVSEVELASWNNFQWVVTATQPLFHGFELVGAHNYNKNAIELNKADLDLEMIDLALDVKKAYFKILKAEKAVNVAEKEVESYRTHLEVTQGFYENGTIAVVDLYTAEVDLANSEQELSKAQNALRLSKSNFNMLLSRPIDSSVNLEDTLSYTPTPVSFEKSMKSALGNRPDLEENDINSRMMDDRIKVAKSDYYPDIDLTYTYVRQGDTPNVSGSDFVDPESWEVAVGLTWYFWDWGSTRNSVYKYESIQKQLFQNRESIKDSIKLEIQTAILNLEEAEKNIPISQKALDLAKESFRVSQERYKERVAVSTEVLDAQRYLSRARMNYYNALYNYNLAKAALQRSIGTY